MTVNCDRECFACLYETLGTEQRLSRKQAVQADNLEQIVSKDAVWAKGAAVVG